MNKEQERIPFWLKALEKYEPAWFRALELRILFLLSAKALKQKLPPLIRKSPEELLKAYRACTAEAVSLCPAEERSARRKLLYLRARRLGQLLGILPGLRSDAVRRRWILFLYREIRITIEGDLPGSFSVPQCFFAGCYTPETCFVMSGLDAGIMAGILRGGNLTFTERLTEGCPACQGLFTRRETAGWQKRN